MTVQAPPEIFGRFFGREYDLIRHTAEDAFRADPFIRPTSWWRDVDRNRIVGGATYSQHLIGTAVDLVESPAAREVWRRAGFIVVEERDHDHVQVYPAGFLERLLGL